MFETEYSIVLIILSTSPMPRPYQSIIYAISQTYLSFSHSFSTFASKHVQGVTIQTDMETNEKLKPNSDYKTLSLTIPPVLATAFPLSPAFFKEWYGPPTAHSSAQLLHTAFYNQRSPLSVILTSTMATFLFLPYWASLNFPLFCLQHLTSSNIN